MLIYDLPHTGYYLIMIIINFLIDFLKSGLLFLNHIII